MLQLHSTKLYKHKTIHWLEVVNTRQRTNLFLIWKINDSLGINSPYTLSHQFYLPQNWHTLFWWFCVAQIHICLNFHFNICGKDKDFLFLLFGRQGKKQSCVIFHTVRFEILPLFVFLFLPDDLQKQLCTPSLVCQGVSALNALSPILHHWKKIFLWYFFGLLIESISPLSCPETPQYKIIVLLYFLDKAPQLANTKRDLYCCEQLWDLWQKMKHWSLFVIKSSTIA